VGGGRRGAADRVPAGVQLRHHRQSVRAQQGRRRTVRRLPC
jgi:hypothetical protein